MRIITKPIFLLIANGIGLVVASYLLENVTLELTVSGIGTTAIVLTGMNVILKPLIKLLLLPVIILTLGSFSFVINAGILFGLDFLLESITINGLTALAEITLIVTAVNLIAGIVKYK